MKTIRIDYLRRLIKNGEEILIDVFTNKVITRFGVFKLSPLYTVQDI